MVSLFDHGSAPAGSQFLDGSPGIKVATTFNFSAAGQVTELWWYCGAQNGGTWTFTGWDITTGDSGGTGAGTQICTQAFVGTPTANAWNKITLSPAVNVSGGNKRYRFAIHNGQYYWVNNNFFNAHDEINGAVSALRDGDTSSPLGLINQGTFTVSSSTTSYPQSTGSKANYAVDITFIASGADGSAALTLPALTLAATTNVAASGAATLALPALTLAGATNVAANGSSALVLPALTLAGQGTAGVSGAAVLTLPHLTLAGAGETAPVAEGALTLPALSFDAMAQVTANSSGGSWESIYIAIDDARAMHQRNEQRRHNPIECPIHGWPLQDTPRGKHCLYGGHIVRTA